MLERDFLQNLEIWELNLYSIKYQHFITNECNVDGILVSIFCVVSVLDLILNAIHACMSVFLECVWYVSLSQWHSHILGLVS